MSIKREPDDLPSGVIVKVNRKLGEDVVDHEEYEEAVDDDDIVYPASHSANAMTLEDVHPGYAP